MEPSGSVQEPVASPPAPEIPETATADASPPTPLPDTLPVPEKRPEPVVPLKTEVPPKPVPRKTPPPEKKTKQVIARKEREPVPNPKPKPEGSSEKGVTQENPQAVAPSKEDGSGTGSGSPGTRGDSGIHGEEGHKSGGGLGSMPAEFQLNQVDQAPVVVEKVEPDYPFGARRQKVTGRVMVKFLVDPRGQVKNISIVKAEPTGIFENSAIEAIGKWRFKPGYYKGQAVSTWVILPIQFKLSG
ncbi:MAG: TonB family protein [Acidobacteriota bacterium]